VSLLHLRISVYGSASIGNDTLLAVGTLNRYRMLWSQLCHLCTVPASLLLLRNFAYGRANISNDMLLTLGTPDQGPVGTLPENADS